MNDFLDNWHVRCSIGRTIVLLKADIRRASDALHLSMKVKNFYDLAVNVVCIEHGI
jgi:hypothetical protein